jgi:hypothetical protein
MPSLCQRLNNEQQADNQLDVLHYPNPPYFVTLVASSCDRAK